MIANLTIPVGAILKIRSNDQVDFNQNFYEISACELISIEIAKQMKVKPEKIFDHLKKNIGDKICTGEVIAKKSGIFSGCEIISEYDGVLKEINHEFGSISINIFKKTTESRNCFFKGTIEKIQENCVQINLHNGEKHALIEISSDEGGKNLIIQNEDELLKITEDDVLNKVIFIKEIKPHILAKLKTLGARAVVFENGSLNSDFPMGKIESFSEYTKIKKEYSLLSMTDKAIYFYNP